MLRPFRLAWLYFKLGSLTELQYRANFFIQLLQTTVAAGTALIVLNLVYSKTDELNGWSEPELQVVMGIQILLGGVIRMSIQPNMERLMEEVRDGKLDFALTKPEDSQVFVSVREVRIWRAVDIFAGALVLAYGVNGLERSVDVGDAALFAAMLLVGALTIYCFWLFITTGAFWIVNTWSILELFEGVYQTGRFPVSIYPGWLRFGVTFLDSDRVRDHRSRRGGDVAARVGDDRARGRLLRGALRLHPLVVGLRPPPLLGRVGVESVGCCRRVSCTSRSSRKQTSAVSSPSSSAPPGRSTSSRQWNAVSSVANVLRGVHAHWRHADYLTVVARSGHDRARRSARRLGDRRPGHDGRAARRTGRPALVLPPGVAHGFYFHEPSLHVYAVDHEWDPDDELGCRWDDPGLEIDWPCEQPLLSSRDEGLGSLSELRATVRRALAPA